MAKKSLSKKDFQKLQTKDTKQIPAIRVRHPILTRLLKMDQYAIATATILFVAVVTMIAVIIFQDGQLPVINNDPDSIEQITGSYAILNTFNIGERYFYQGLEFIDETHLLMGEGMYGQSALAVLKFDDKAFTVTQEARYPMNTEYFGEGATFYPKDGRVYELTWTDGVILVYENLLENDLRPTFLKQIPLPSEIQEGWGITHDDNYLYISNGSKNIFVCQPNADLSGLDIIRTIQVDTLGTNPHFNELEMRDNEFIYANSFLSNYIYKIRISDGKLVKFWDIPDLLAREKTYVTAQGEQNSYDWGNNVLNGIAYRAKKKTFLLTGKRWDFMFEVDLQD